jgi:hypothetical protein
MDLAKEQAKLIDWRHRAWTALAVARDRMQRNEDPSVFLGMGFDCLLEYEKADIMEESWVQLHRVDLLATLFHSLVLLHAAETTRRKWFESWDKGETERP